MMNVKINDYKVKLLIIIAYMSMITFGLLETLKGAVIPSIRGEFLVDYGQIGQMLFIALLGFLISVFIAGMASEKYGLKRVFLFGIIMIIISTILFSFIPGFYGVTFVYFLLGLGLGCIEIGVNALGGEIFVKNKAMMMNLMHLFFGVGAMIAPKYAGLFISKGVSWKYSYLATIVLTIFLLTIVLFTKFPKPKTEGKNQKISFRVLAKSSKVWLITIILGLFITMESGIANWLINYLQVARSLDVISSTNYLTWFFGLFTFGRLIGGFFADKIGFTKILIAYTLAASISLIGGIFLGDNFLVLFSLTGFFISIMFPTMMALIMTEYKNGVGAVMGFAITVSGIFNMVSGWLIGNINDIFGVTGGIVAIATVGITAFILIIILHKQTLQIV